MEDMSIWTNPVTMKDIKPPKLEKMGDYVYLSQESGVELVRCSNVGEKLYLPDRIRSSWITSLGTGALSNCEKLVNAVLPHSLRCIGDYAFFQCDRLQDVRISDSVRSIGERAFAQCRSLRNVYVPPTVDSIGEGAFEGIEDLTLTGEEDSAIHRYARENGLLFMTASGPAA